MKILLTTESYYPNIDGGAIAQYNLVNELTKHGHEIYVIAPGFSFKNTVEEDNGTRVFRTRAVKLPLYMKSRYHFSPFPLFRIGKIIQKYRQDRVGIAESLSAREEYAMKESHGKIPSQLIILGPHTYRPIHFYGSILSRSSLVSVVN